MNTKWMVPSRERHTFPCHQLTLTTFTFTPLNFFFLPNHVFQIFDIDILLLIFFTLAFAH